jgi:hypothetical protein
VRGGERWLKEREAVEGVRGGWWGFLNPKITGILPTKTRGRVVAGVSLVSSINVSIGEPDSGGGQVHGLDVRPDAHPHTGWVGW